MSGARRADPAAPRPGVLRVRRRTRSGCGCRSRRRRGSRRYVAPVHFCERHQAGPGLVHGGLVAAALDEACGLLATWYRFPTVTARIFVRYRRPVPINTELVAARQRRERARAADPRPRRRSTDGDEPLAEARAAFLHVPLEHFLATPEGRAAGEAWRRRLDA